MLKEVSSRPFVSAPCMHVNRRPRTYWPQARKEWGTEHGLGEKRPRALRRLQKREGGVKGYHLTFTLQALVSQFSRSRCSLQAL